MSLTAIRKHLQTAGEHVGDLLWWMLADASISRPRLERIWTDAGLPLHHLPEPPTHEKALKTAARECQVGQHDHLIRLSHEDDNELIFAVVEERRDGHGNLTHHQHARIILNRFNPSRLDTDDPSHPLVSNVFSAYDRLVNTHTASDVRRALVKTLGACAAVTLREHGGVYWVPAPFSSTVRQLQDAVSHIGGSRLDLVPIHASAEAQQALGDAARASITDEIGALQKEIEGFLSAPPDRPSTLLNRLKAFEELRGKARLYHAVLNVQVGDLESSLDALARHVEGLLSSHGN